MKRMKKKPEEWAAIFTSPAKGDEIIHDIKQEGEARWRWRPCMIKVTWIKEEKAGVWACARRVEECGRSVCTCGQGVLGIRRRMWRLGGR